MAARDPADAAAERQAGDARVRHVPVRDRQAPRSRGARDVAQQRAASDAGAPSAHVELHAVQRRQVEGQPAVGHGVALHAVTPATHGDLHSVVAGAQQRLDDLRVRARPRDGRRTVVDRAVPGLDRRRAGFVGGIPYFGPCRFPRPPFVSSATIHPKEDAMKYMLLIHQGTTPLPGTDAWERLSASERGAVFAGYRAVNETPGMTPGQQLQPPETATTVRVEDGRTLTTDGPFVEIKEAVGGYCFFEADDLDAAIELAAKIPAAGMGGAVEVRPIVER
jgi:hypothetical protein